MTTARKKADGLKRRTVRGEKARTLAVVGALVGGEVLCTPLDDAAMALSTLGYQEAAWVVLAVHQLVDGQTDGGAPPTITNIAERARAIKESQ